ncbi:MAG: ABC transporter permease [Alphaproteobacteria bacterium]|nr:ABC transporter permease [Beijerinckiaceae bacterium]NBQ38686.1 ABC transporter permease [Alphaproteobacteria bacterium]
MIQSLFQTRGLWIGAIIIFTLLMIALFSLLPGMPDPTLIRVVEKLRSPSIEHWLGTDQLGRDLLGLTMRGASVSLLVAIGAVTLGAGIGVPLGLMASAHENWLSQAVMRANDFIFAFPALVIAILLHDTVGAGIQNAILAIGIFNIPVFARVVYNKAQSIWTLDFIQAARLIGRRDINIALLHVLPLALGTIIVQITIQLGLGILAEAGLSYVGLGVTPPTPSWGRMLNEAQTLIGIAPRLALVPGLAIALAVLGFTLLGDALSEWVDPRKRNSG